MGEPTDPKALSADLMKAVQLLARDAVATALAAGTMPGTDGVALAPRLREIAATELEDVERLAARIVSLGGSPSVTVKRIETPSGCFWTDPVSTIPPSRIALPSAARPAAMSAGV